MATPVRSSSGYYALIINFADMGRVEVFPVDVAARRIQCVFTTISRSILISASLQPMGRVEVFPLDVAARRIQCVFTTISRSILISASLQPIGRVEFCLVDAASRHVQCVSHHGFTFRLCCRRSPLFFVLHSAFVIARCVLASEGPKVRPMPAQWQRLGESSHKKTKPRMGGLTFANLLVYPSSFEYGCDIPARRSSDCPQRHVNFLKSRCHFGLPVRQRR